jgi:hypothetical protein
VAQRFTAVTIPTPLDKANKRYSVPTCSGGHTGDTDTVVQRPAFAELTISYRKLGTGGPAFYCGNYTYASR